jgi:L-2,4-diaminobutyric acid acetyltransferase
MTSSPVPLELNQPTSEDGPALYHLIERCPPLDPNSRYCNLLQCAHFGDTSVLAWSNWQGPEQLLVGSVTGYIPPQQPTVLFIWQVAVAVEGRGKGLAKSMLMNLLKRPACREVQFIETTITLDNQASWGLFRSLARDLKCGCEEAHFFDQQQHFDGQHQSEFLCRIGPFINPTLPTK